MGQQMFGSELHGARMFARRSPTVADRARSISDRLPIDGRWLLADERLPAHRYGGRPRPCPTVSDA